jgi:uroporphyrinogen III methyltransferase/synthase
MRGVARLMQCDVVVHDEFVSPSLLELPRPDVRRLAVSRGNGKQVASQEHINGTLLRLAKENKRVVRLIYGDAFLFGSGGKEGYYLANNGIPFEVVPGIMAEIGGTATAGIPLVYPEVSSSCVLAGAPERGEHDFKVLSQLDTAVFPIHEQTIEDVCKGLLEAGKHADTPAAAIQWGTRSRQRTVMGKLQDIAERAATEGISIPAFLVVGPVVQLRNKMDWFENRPLHDKTVVVTRMKHEADDLAAPLQFLGAEVLVVPTIQLASITNYSHVDNALKKLADYEWLVLTSKNGVDAMFSRLEQIGKDARWLGNVKIAVVGSGTASSLEKYSVKPDLVPPEAVGESLADALIKEGVSRKKVLLLRADIARSRLPIQLKEAGAHCDDLPIYRTISPKRLPDDFVYRLEHDEIDWITFTSPSTFSNLLNLLGRKRGHKLWSCKLASIGPVTTRAIREAGFMEAAEASPHDIRGLVASLRSIQTQ